MDSELMIKVSVDSEDVLVGFPYQPGQFHDGCEDDESDSEYTYLRVVLADATDTTTAQEQFLNTNDKVLEYTVR